MNFDEVKAEIAKMIEAGKSYGYIGNKYELNKGIIYHIHKNNHEPKRQDIRRKLGLEDMTIDFVRQVRSSRGTFTSNKGDEDG